ncbi:tRNA (adenosine(37)-N6)-threonylcarbamoyltransferase complex ATPase subunit type 1 TsaE [Candidatus Saccharibacteria bacterium]|nr:tRNA (adenosine(37)-N6)-threonylcarbamoyltransferase complex ATPase subunit type 1 TsaE [Candidatus Saccharibacteria bacterium]
MALRLAQNLKPPLLIELVGDLGGGKTAFVKALGRALGVEKTIVSPTFTIHQSYKTPSGGSLEHFDLYRLTDDQLVQNELADSLENGNSVVCVEWAEHFHSHLSNDRLVIKFEFVNDDSRKLTLNAMGPKSRGLLEAIK